MRVRTVRFLTALFAAVTTVLLVAGGQPARAGTIYINNATATGTTATVTQALYRVSNANFDSRLTNGQSASVVANIIPFSFGNFAALNGNTYDFSLEWVAGTVGVNRGFIWTLSTGTGVVSKTAFGTFTPPLSGLSVPAADPLNGISPSGTFNALGLSQRSTNTSGGSTTTLANLTFSTSQPGTSQSGAWINTSIVTPNGGPLPPGINGADGFINQTMIADFDLSAYPWTLTGQVTVNRGGSIGSGDDSATFQITGRQVEFVPEPSELAFVAGLATALGAWQMRKLRRMRGNGEAAAL
jgi:hypothetical protein